jgi:glycosyltransferase involved in cell wall biosynthesis
LFSDKINFCHLGINKINNCLSIQKEGEFNLFSCSFMVAVKRVSLIISYIIALAKAYPQVKFVWTHAGGGELFDSINDFSKRIDLENLKIILLNSVDNTSVISNYVQNPVDVFLSLTETEGGVPVTMQESQSFGVPIVATNVGGVGEIVIDGKTGFLLSENPTEEEFIEKIVMLLNNKTLLSRMRENSLRNWEENFNAEKNHKKFVSEITIC